MEVRQPGRIRLEPVMRERAARRRDQPAEALAVRATRGRHANVLQHLAGYFKRDLGPDGRAELVEVVDEYRRGLVPLIAPITLVRHHARRLGIAYLTEHVYLSPHPKELMLRNHV